MKLYTKVFLLFCVALISSSAVEAYDVGGKKFKPNETKSCYIDYKYNDWYWFCGNQEQSCRGTDVAKRNIVRWYNHGEYFRINNTDAHNEGNYWCCGGTNSSAGTFVKTIRTITKDEIESKVVTETLTDADGRVIGTCTWTQQISKICGTIENPQDKCTMPDNCASGQVLFPRVCSNPSTDDEKNWCNVNAGLKRCVAPCQDGYVFASDTSPECVPCETTTNQGIKNGVCVKCESNEFFDKNTLTCVKKPDMLAITTAAHERCWPCSNPTTLALCMRVVSMNGGLPLPTDTALPSTVSVGSKNVSRTSKEYKSMYDDCTLFYDGSVERQSGTGSTTGNNYVDQANVHDSQPDVAIDTSFSDDVSADGTSAKRYR